MIRIVIIFHRLGPYHHARLRAASGLGDIKVIEVSSVDKTYSWKNMPTSDHFHHITLFDDRDALEVPSKEIAESVAKALDEFSPKALAVPGWSANYSLAGIWWGLANQIPCVIMSESSGNDSPHTWWKEFIKRRILGLASTALVGGKAHAEYLGQLGMSIKTILRGYDTVDNGYFEQGADSAREDTEKLWKRLSLPDTYFLACARFIPKKNLSTLLKAYKNYSETIGGKAWSLVIIGDGPMRGDLEQQVKILKIDNRVFMPGFKQYDEIPAYYGLANAFIHASTVEQWGLVVNEAMAAGLPVLVSNRCGCAPDLVREGINGFTFDPYDIEGLARLMVRISSGEFNLSAMGKASRQIIAEWTPETFAVNLWKAVNEAITMRRPQPSVIDKAILRALMLR